MRPVTIELIGFRNNSAAYLDAAPSFRSCLIAASADLDTSRAPARTVEFGLTAMSVDALLAGRRATAWAARQRIAER